MPHSNKIISGIDIGSTKITTLVGQYFDNEDRFNIIAVSSTPSLGFRKGQIINLDQAAHTLTQSIEAAERMAGFQIDHAYVSFAAPHIHSLNSQGIIAISSPSSEISSSEIDRAIEAVKAVSLPSGQEIIDVIPRKYTVDGQEGIINPVGMNGSRLEIEAHLVTASGPALKNIYKCLDEVGINIQSLIYSGLATAKAALTDTETELGICLVDIGGSTTTITIFTEGSPCYSSVIPVGAINITNDLAIGLRFSLDEAEKIKIKLAKVTEDKRYEDEIDLSHFGINSDSHHHLSLSTAIGGIIRPRLEEIFGMVNQEIQNSGFSHLIPAGVVLTGGGSLTVQAKEICSQIVPLPIKISTPPKVGGLVDDILTPAYTSAVGLLMYGLQENKQNPKSSTGRKNIMSFTGVFDRLKNLIEPLLP